jgi:hypothetical protein
MTAGEINTALKARKLMDAHVTWDFKAKAFKVSRTVNGKTETIALPVEPTAIELDDAVVFLTSSFT